MRYLLFLLLFLLSGQAELFGQKQPFRFFNEYPQYLNPARVGITDSISITASAASFSFDIEDRSQSNVLLQYKIPKTKLAFGLNYFRLNSIANSEFTNSIKASNHFEIQGSYYLNLPNEVFLSIGLGINVFQRQGQYFPYSYIGEIGKHELDMGLGLSFQKKNFNVDIGIEHAFSEHRTFTIVGGLNESLFFEERFRNIYLFATNKFGTIGNSHFTQGVYFSSLNDGAIQVGLERKDKIFNFALGYTLTNGQGGWNFNIGIRGLKRKRIYCFLSFNSLWQEFDPMIYSGLRFAIKQ